MKRWSAASAHSASASGATKSGWTRSSTERLVSRTRSRRPPVRRRRRSLVTGNELIREGYAPRTPNRRRRAGRGREPGRLARQAAPGMDVEQGGREEPDAVCERQGVAHPAGRREELAGDQAEEDDRQHDQDGDERRRPGLARNPADQRTQRAERPARERAGRPRAAAAAPRARHRPRRPSWITMPKPIATPRARARPRPGRPARPSRRPAPTGGRGRARAGRGRSRRAPPPARRPRARVPGR